MRTPATILAVLVLCTCQSSAEEHYSLSGDWYFDVLTSPNGPGQREVLFLQEGERVIGFIESNSASGRFVGRFDGARVEFTAVLEFGGQPMAAVYEAQVDGDTMSGTIEYGLYGRATFVGFRGRRPPESGDDDMTLIGSAAEAEIDAAADGDFFGIPRGGVLTPEMIAVEGGRFRMGNDGPAVNPDYGKDFAHVHPVEVSDFRMSRFPVTNAQYLAFCEATGREPPSPPKGWGDYWHRYPNHPATNVNAADAVAYADWLSDLSGDTYRLPTEAEWEYAARAGTEGKNYVFGDDWIVDAANISIWRIGAIPDRDGWKEWWDREGDRMSKSRPMTTRVGQFPPNDWGFQDMTGNVWEWMHDWYQADYYVVSPAKDPMGPPAGDEKVLRGCSWYNKPDVCFIATRDRYAPQVRLYYNGFRVVAHDAAGSP
ncbi:MAG: formylglycine-generating enzyme family protein [Gammaproteobacteria bacterium]